MAVSVYEKWETRSQSGERIERVYVAHGTTDPNEAWQGVIAEAPEVYSSRYRQLLGIQQTRIGQAEWLVTVPYTFLQSSDRQVGSDPEYSFDTTGGTAHITQSLDTKGSYVAAGDVADDFKQAIGVTEDGNVEGTNVTIGRYAWAERHFLALTLVTESYKLLLATMTGGVNLDYFRAFAPGEVEFKGARGRQRGNQDVDLSFHFEASPNIVGGSVGDIHGIVKGGHEYAWVRYAKDTGVRMVPKPVQVNVEQVQYEWPFVLLGIG